ncbi:MAG TPA: glycerol kinase GlpK [Candidatus Limnocylindrales bacterium]|nr:glycerol kinase GlpK [Candidatus Limnocylindrales bacterium]
MAREPRYVLALDQGTSSSRAIVYDEEGRQVGAGQLELRSSYPRPGLVEQNADEIVETQLRAARDALDAARIGAGNLAAVGITNQRETTVAWDPRGRPLAPAIVWQDRRTAERCAELRATGLGPRVREVSGLLLDPYFSATKMSWLLDSIPDGRPRAESGELRLGTVDAWLAWRLTGGRTFATDATNASRTLLLDIAHGEWSAEMAGLFAVPLAALPEVRATDADFGMTEAGLLGTPVPIRAMAGDQQAALFGQGCFEPGDAKNTYGTGCFLLVTTGSEMPIPPEGLLSTIAWRRRATISYALEGSVFVAGAAVRWLRDLGLIRDAREVESLAASVDDSGRVVVVPAFAGLGAPWWDPDARGAILGLTAGTTAAHIARATLESIAQQTADLVDAFESGGSVHLSVLRADGGAAGNDLLLQLQADLLGRPVARSATRETTAFGAALLAGLAAGVWESDEQVRGLARADRVFDPARSDEWRAEMRGRWAEAVSRVRSRPR